MEGLAPTLRCVLEVRFALENGESVRTGLISAMGRHSDPFTLYLRRWLFAWDQERAVGSLSDELTLYQRHFVMLIEHGLRGNSIHRQLSDLEEEVVLACEEQVDLFVRMLPFKMAIPVLLFQFPAFLLLLLGPLLNELVRSLR